MADAYQIETSTDRYLLESGTFVYLLEDGLFVVDSFNRADGLMGVADVGGTWTNDTNINIASNKARLVLGAGQSGSTHLPGTYADLDAEWMLQMSNVTSYDTELRVRDDNAGNLIRCGISGSAGGNFFIQQKVGGGALANVAVVGSNGFVAATDYRIRLQLIGTLAQARWWVDGAAEPTTWLLSGITAVTKAGWVGIDGFASTALNIDYDNLNVGRIGINDAVAVDEMMPYIGGGYSLN